MKKGTSLLLLIAAGMFTAQSLSAQSSGLEFSVVAGLSKSSIYGDSESYKDPIGGMAGVIMNFAKISDESILLRAELNLSMQGAKWEDDWGEGLIEGRMNLLYLNLPVVARYKFDNGFYAEAGIQPGFLLSAKDKYEKISDNVKDILSVFDFGIPLGVGYEFDNNLGLGLRVVPGIANINEENDYKDHNLVFTLRVTYNFTKKKDN